MSEHGRKKEPRESARGGDQKLNGEAETTDQRHHTPVADVVQGEKPAITHKSIFRDPDFLVQQIEHHKRHGLKRLLEIRRTFGFDVVLVPVARGQKRPLVSGYPDFTIEKMEDLEYLNQLEQANVSVLTGPNSNGLVSIDLDDDDRAEEFRNLNPDLCAGTVKTWGARGCNYWFEIEGGYPIGPIKFADVDDQEIGELRAGRCITVADGVHPKGVNYRRVGGSVVSCSFDDIEWPEDWKLPWVEDPMDQLVAKEGLPFTVGERGGITLNEPVIVEKFAQEHLVLHDPGLGFYEYDDNSGVWESRTRAFVMSQFSDDIKFIADETEQPGVLNKRNATLLRSLTDQLAGRVEQANAFRDRPEGVIHASNGMLEVTADSVDVKEFCPTYRSLGRIPIDYDPVAKCPRFLNELLHHALPENDILLLQKYAGQVLLGKNLSQTFLILEGEGGAGKGQIGSVIDQIVGTRNVAELRTSHLAGRFEMKSFVGKNLLAGRDVPGDFLNQKGAPAIKKLTGGDLISVESKGKDERSEIVGEFNIIVTANSRLVVAIEGDKSAWRRRLLVIPFEREPVNKPIPNFGKLLVQEEGEGILAWMVEGAQLLLRDIKGHGRIQLDALQRKRITDLLAESDSVMAFVTRRVVPEKQGKVHTRELFEAFTDFSLNHDLPPVTKAAFNRRLRSEMLDAHGSVASENVERHGRRGRGYLGVRLLGDSEEDAVGS